MFARCPRWANWHETTLYSKELDTLFAADLAYNKVHLWLGVGVYPDYRNAGFLLAQSVKFQLTQK